MNKQRNWCVAALLSAACAVLAGTVSAATLNDVFAVAEQLNAQARQSQAKIDALTDETRQLLGEYKTVLKEIEGLRVYNRQLDKQIANQQAEMAQLAASIDEVTVIERQITPLMMRMIDGLEQFVDLDLPFLTNNADIRSGDLLVTSGLGGTFPAGYPVAVVETVTRVPQEPFADVTARPAASLDQVREVMLIWSASAQQPAEAPDE